MKHRHLDQSTPIILLYFDNIPISPYGHPLLSRRQESLLFLVMAHKLNLHTEEFFWDVPDAGSWINIKALRVDMCLLSSSKHQGEIFSPLFLRCNVRPHSLFQSGNKPICVPVVSMLNLLWLIVIDISIAEILVQVGYPL